MNEPGFDEWEDRLQKTAESFPYPPTPDIAQAVMERLQQRRPTQPIWRQRVAWAVALLVVILAASLATPQVRAALSYILRIGAIQVFVGEPTPTPTPMPTRSPGHPATSTPQPVTIADIAGETSLGIAQGRADFLLHVPAYPPDLGLPDKVYLQERPYYRDQVVILVWLEAQEPERARLTLYQIGSEDFGFKEGAEFVQETRVNSEWAIWVKGPHTLRLRNGRLQPWLFVEGNVLIWFHDGITYRLESGLSLEEAVKVAESLAPVNSEQ